MERVFWTCPRISIHRSLRRYVHQYIEKTPEMEIYWYNSANLYEGAVS